MNRTDIVSHARALAEAPAGIARKPPKGQKPMVVPASAPRDPVAAALLLKQRTGASGGQGKGKVYQRPKGGAKKWDKDEAAPTVQREGRIVDMKTWFVAVMADGTTHKETFPGLRSEIKKPDNMKKWFESGKKHFPNEVRLDVVDAQGKILASYPKGAPGPKDHAKKEGAPFRRLPPVQESAGLTFVATLADGTRVPHRSQVTEGQLTRTALADMGARAKRRFPTAERIEARAGDEVVMEMAINYIGSFRRPPSAE